MYNYLVITDASFKKVDDKGYCGYGVAIVNTSTLQYTTFGDMLPSGHTIAYGELWGIYRGVEKALQFIGKKADARILVVTDNKLAVNGFTLWIPKVWDISDWHNWKTLHGKPVKNQVVYRKTLELISKYPRVTVRMSHMHGHGKRKDIEKLRNDLRIHGIIADDDTVELFRSMNAMVDKIAGSVVDRKILLDQKYGEVPELVRKEFEADARE